MKPIAPNTLIQNRYLIVHLIGKGGMGEVYLAVDQRLGSAIALKRTFFSDDVLLGNAFEREARTLARLRHPVLPKVSDHFTDDGTQYLVMDHISGEDISKRLEAAQKPFPLSWVLFWADQLLDALTYLHTHEPPIIHRDIKPQNLKLTDENHIVLLDFGLSKNSTAETRATTSGSSIVGYTPHYAPMEQIRGTGTDARSDLYSLSATLYQILVGSVPPDALTRADSLINGLPDPVKPINELNPEVSKAVSDVIIKGMAISQEQRYKSAREMQRALRDAFSRKQTEMAANTVEYSNGSEPAILQAQSESNSLSAAHNSAPSAANSGSVVPAANESSIPSNNSAATDFDATLRYDSAAHDSAPKQSAIKTEVFLAGSIPEAISPPPVNESFLSEISAAPIVEDAAPAESAFFTQSDFNQPHGYSPDQTMPNVSYGDQSNGGDYAANDSAFFPESPATDKTATLTAAPEITDSRPLAAPSAAIKSKSNKTLFIGAGFAALLLAVVSAIAVGWYMTRNNTTKTQDITPAPTPEATQTVEATPAPTVEIINQTNVNSNLSATDNSNSQNVNAIVSQPIATPTTVPVAVPTATPIRNIPTPPPNVVRPPRGVPPTPKPPPRPEKTRTIIVQ